MSQMHWLKADDPRGCGVEGWHITWRMKRHGMTDTQTATVWLGAFRYYRGRMTYAVSDFVEALVAEWEKLPADAKGLIRRELDAAFASDDRTRATGSPVRAALGDDMDREQWERVRALWG